MYLSGISVRKIAGVTEALSRVKVGKDAVTRIHRPSARREAEGLAREVVGGEGVPLPLSARHLSEGQVGAGLTSMALLACVGVDEEGFREVLAIEVAGSEKGAPYPSLLCGG